jgi:hypothetical protein
MHFTYILAQMYTDPRRSACSDPRNFINLAAMGKALIGTAEHKLYVNMDATSFEIVRDKEGKIVWHIHRKGDKNPVRRSGQGGMGVNIKEVNLVCSNGDVSESVYVISDKTMGEDECLHKAVPALSSSIIAGTIGHLFIMKSRSPNHLFMEMYNKFILFPFFDNIRLTDQASRNYGVESDDSNSRDTPIVFFLDGEDKQLDVYRSDEVAASMEYERVCIVKLPPSSTSKTQPLDVGKKT